MIYLHHTKSNSTYPPPPPVEQPEEEESTKKVLATTLFEGFDQKANQLYNLLSSVLKNMKEMSSGTTRNML